jgi:hypothetical protein
MRKLFLLVLLLVVAACAGYTSPEKIKIAFDDIPYKTEKNLRIGYTLQTWEYEKEGFELQQIKVLDKDSMEELCVIEKENLPKIYKDPISPDPYFTFDTLTNYYLSIQLPIPLGKTPPKAVFHRLLFKKIADSSEVTVEGAAFSPRASESPMVISSPLKGKNMVFLNQSNNGYHFCVLIFTGGVIFRPERYAFDMIEPSDDLAELTSGDPAKNTSYFHYGKTIYAVADGVVGRIQDGLPENSGNAQDITFSTSAELPGNYLMQDLGGGKYAFYGHCIPGSFLVKEGDRIKEGDPIARLGNSGNSSGPHLHFQITDGPDFFMSNGQPFVLKQYTKTGEADTEGSSIVLQPNQYQTFTNAMMEVSTVFRVE